MKNFFNKYLFFLNPDSQNGKDNKILLNLILIISFLFLVIYKRYNISEVNSLGKFYSGFLTFTLIYLSTIWIDIKEFKKTISEMKIIIKEKDWKFETMEIYYATTILTYLLITITLVFIIDWEIVGSQGINKSGFLGIVIVLLSIYQYRKYVKSVKKKKPLHVIKKERMEQKWWQKFFG